MDLNGFTMPKIRDLFFFLILCLFVCLFVCLFLFCFAVCYAIKPSAISSEGR